MKIEICTGLAMPFYPMRPRHGRRLGRPEHIRQLWHEAVEQKLWSMQPKLGGDRAGLAVVDKHVFVQNRHGSRYRCKVKNGQDFLRLPNHTCFDGEVFKGNFYPFELLACNGNSLLLTEVHERVALAKDLVKFLKHPWMFETPSLAWLLRRSRNLPIYEGVVLKRAASRYVLLGSATQSNFEWLKRLWA